MSFQCPKGTFDILPYGAKEPWKHAFLWHYIEGVFREVVTEYGYQEIRTPIYEKTDLFDRGIGESSDIVMKEMFSFTDKANRPLSLRPEGTAGVMRAFLEHHLDQSYPYHKLFYFGPMFRYERPQSGRYRQHHQFGVEMIGSSSAEQDAELIEMLCRAYDRLGLKQLTVQLNTVGDLPSRQAYREALLTYLSPYKEDLSEDSQLRLQKNPLRILDSKDLNDQKILENAPSIYEHLTEEAKAHFEKVQETLTLLNIPYHLNDQIVRGLDYYQKTVFEITAQSTSAQNTIGAGGRYDGLLHSFGGPNLPGIGFASGLERVLQLLIEQQAPLPQETSPFLYFVPIGEGAKARCIEFASTCRKAHIPCDIELNGKKLQHALQYADKKKIPYVALLGEEEIQNNTLQLKNLKERTAEILSQNDWLQKITTLYS